LPALLEIGFIPSVNETTRYPRPRSNGQLQSAGGQHTLSANVGHAWPRDLLILLSDIDGLYTQTRIKTAVQRHQTVTAITPELRGMAGGSGRTWRGTGAMALCGAAEIALKAGVEMVVIQRSALGRFVSYVAGRTWAPVFARRVSAPENGGFSMTVLETQASPAKKKTRARTRPRRNSKKKMRCFHFSHFVERTGCILAPTVRILRPRIGPVIRAALLDAVIERGAHPGPCGRGEVRWRPSPIPSAK
jgi:glutamate 5-kinase